MPTREQIEATLEHIKDVIERNYVESDGDMCSCWFQPEHPGPIGMGLVQGKTEGTPEPFAELPSKAQIELLTTFVQWEGFDRSQEWGVIQRILDGESIEFLMDGIEPDARSASEEIASMFEAIAKGYNPAEYAQPSMDQGKEGPER